jgi:hypothetical protein
MGDLAQCFGVENAALTRLVPPRRRQTRWVAANRILEGEEDGPPSALLVIAISQRCARIGTARARWVGLPKQSPARERRTRRRS